MKKLLTTCTALLLAVVCFSQNFWQETSLPVSAQPGIPLHQYRSLSLDAEGLRHYLPAAPMEFTAAAQNQPLSLLLPLPDGRMERFGVCESPVMEPALAAKFPQIKTYSGRSLERAGATVRFTCTPEGFNGVLRLPEGESPLMPAGQGSPFYVSFFLKDVIAQPGQAIACDVHGADWDGFGIQYDPVAKSLETSGEPRGLVLTDLQTYRLAVATTNEFSLSAGNSVPSVMVAVTTVVNNINGVMENENGIRLVLIDNTDQTFFFNFNGDDGYSNGNTDDMINENPGKLNVAYTASGYDIGHVFGTNAGGLASVGSVCGDALTKGRGVSCTFGNIYDLNGLFYLIVTHEMGHQFSALHNFNNCDGTNESAPTAYEPGSGSTIMCYAGASDCGPNYVQDFDDSYFNINALERIRAFSRDAGTGGSCAVTVTVGNNNPVANIPFAGGFSIPISTPFDMTGSATDADGDDLTYNWEQFDLGPSSTLGTPIGTAPLFRSMLPNASPTRVFPQMATIVNNLSDINEVLPTISRAMTFRFNARDYHAGAGAWGYDEILFNANANAGPFRVSQPNTAGQTWTTGDFLEVKWDVANSNNAPVNCQNVDIKLSTDGGFTYPILLKANTPNDGSAFIVVPDNVTSTARVMVHAADNIFFDISNFNHSIVPPAAPGFAFDARPESGQVCLPGTFTINVTTAALLGFTENITLSAPTLPAGAVFSALPNPVTPGQASVVTIDLNNTTTNGSETVVIAADATGVSTQNRTIQLTLVSSDFSALNYASPIDGSAGVGALPGFNWTPLSNATSYDIEIATSPLFGASVVDAATGLTFANYTPSITLSNNTIYYWRVRPYNECGAGEFKDPAAFSTLSQTCLEYNSTAPSMDIPFDGTPVVGMTIDVPQGGVISDFNVLQVKGNHDLIAHLEIRVKAPDGDTVRLLKSLPCLGQLFDLGFDDQSALTSIPCPPNTGSEYRPKGMLSKFNGKNSLGTWTMEVAVTNAQGNGGTFEKWGMEICAAFQSANPAVLKNDTLKLKPTETRFINSLFLEFSDADNTPDQLTFTIVKKTAEGIVKRNGIALNTGDQFTMADIYNGLMQYTNVNPLATYDYFTFVVSDGGGGLYGTPRFNIIIDPNVSASELLPADGIRLYPNPASQQVTLEFLETPAGEVSATLTDVQGRHLLTRRFHQTQSSIQLPLGDLPAGVYTVQVGTAKGVFVKKLIVE